MQMARDTLDSEQLETNPHVNLIVASQRATRVHPEVDVVHQQGPSVGLENYYRIKNECYTSYKTIKIENVYLPNVSGGSNGSRTRSRSFVDLEIGLKVRVIPENAKIINVFDC